MMGWFAAINTSVCATFFGGDMRRRRLKDLAPLHALSLAANLTKHACSLTDCAECDPIAHQIDALDETILVTR